MKTILFLSMSLISMIVSASDSVPFYTIITFEQYSSEELARQCAEDRDSAAVRLSDISMRLSPEAPNALTVTSNHGRRTVRTGSSRMPSYTYEYYCMLNFQTTNPALYFDKYSVTRFIHISRGNWDSACQPAYQSALENKNSPVSIYSKFWTLLQGRSCDVDTIEVRKKASN